MRPRVAGADPNFEGFARLHGVDAALRQHAPVEEGVAGPIREFDEPKAFLGGEPFDNPTDRGTGRIFDAESTGLWVVGVGVEVAAPRMTKIEAGRIGHGPILTVHRPGSKSAPSRACPDLTFLQRKRQVRR